MFYRVATQGYAASFHDVAARQFLGNNIALLSCDTFADVFKLVVDGKADLGVVAVANSNYGPIAETEALLASEPITWLDDLTLPIEQCLLGLPGADLADIREVYSHEVALKQCSTFLEQNLPQAALCTHADTAGAAADVHSWNDPVKACIASEAAAKLHGLRVLAHSIQNDAGNCTTFVLFEKR